MPSLTLCETVLLHRTFVANITAEEILKNTISDISDVSVNNGHDNIDMKDKYSWQNHKTLLARVSNCSQDGVSDLHDFSAWIHPT